MSLLLALFLSPALAADLPQDPVERKMVVSEEEHRGAQEMQRAQDAMDQLKALREQYARDGDLTRYGKLREPLVEDIRDRFEQLGYIRSDIRRLNYNTSIANALSVASDMREGKKKRAEAVVGTRTVQFTRLLSLDQQLEGFRQRTWQAFKDENDFFAAEQENAAQRRLINSIGTAAFLALAAGGTFLFFRLRRKA